MAGPMLSSIILDPESAAFVRRMIEAERYVDANDVVVHALRLLEDRERGDEIRRGELFAKIEEGMEDIRAGRMHDAEEVFREMEDLIASKDAKRDAAE